MLSGHFEDLTILYGTLRPIHGEVLLLFTIRELINPIAGFGMTWPNAPTKSRNICLSQRKATFAYHFLGIYKFGKEIVPIRSKHFGRFSSILNL